MIRLRVLHYKIIDMLHIDDLPQIFQIFVEKFLLCGFKKNSLVPCFQHVRIVCCTKFRVHNDIKDTQVGVYNPRPIKILP